MANFSISVEDVGGDKHIAVTSAGLRRGGRPSVRHRVVTAVAKKAGKRIGSQSAGEGWDEVKKPWLIILQAPVTSVVRLLRLRRGKRFVVIFAAPVEWQLTVLPAVATAIVQGHGKNQAMRGDYD